MGRYANAYLHNYPGGRCTVVAAEDADYCCAERLFGVVKDSPGRLDGSVMVLLPAQQEDWVSE